MKNIRGSSTDRVVLRSRIRSGSLGLIAVGWAVLWAWAASSSPAGVGDIVLYVVFVTPVFALLVRMASERVVADPAADTVQIRNLTRTHTVRWDDVARFEATQGRALIPPSAWVTCVLEDGRRLRVRSAGRWIGGIRSPSLTSRKSIGAIAQELQVRRLNRVASDQV